MAHSQTKNGTIDNYLAEGAAIVGNTIVTHSLATDQAVITAVDGSAPIVGVAKCNAAVDEKLDVLEVGCTALIKLATAVTAGQEITATAAGEGTAATAGDYVVGTAVEAGVANQLISVKICLLYTSPSPRDQRGSRMPSSA